MCEAYARVVRLQQSNFNAFFLEVALGLSKVQRSVVWRSVPLPYVSIVSPGNCMISEYQFVKKVILSEDILR